MAASPIAQPRLRVASLSLLLLFCGAMGGTAGGGCGGPCLEEIELPAPLLSDRLKYRVLRPNSSAQPALPRDVFKLGTVLYVYPTFSGPSVSDSAYAGLKAVTEAMGRKALRTRLANGSEAELVFESHVYFWTQVSEYWGVNGSALRRTDRLALHRSIVSDARVNAVLIVSISFNEAPTVLELVTYLEQTGTLTFTLLGDGSDINPVSGERYKYRWDLTPPFALYPKPFLKQLSLLQQSDPQMRNIAVVALEGFDARPYAQLALSMGHQVVMLETVPSSLAHYLYMTDDDPRFQAQKGYWVGLARNLSSHRAGALLYMGYFEVLSLTRVLKELDINLSGGIWSIPYSIDETFGRQSMEHSQLHFASSNAVTKPDVPDPLFGTVGNFSRQMADANVAFLTIARVSAFAGTLLTSAFETFQMTDVELINRKMPSMTIPDSITGAVKFGSHRYLDEQSVKLFQYFDGKLTPVLPTHYAERLITLPVPQWACRGNTSLNGKCSCAPGNIGSEDSLRCVPCDAGFKSAGGIGATCRPCSAGSSSTRGAGNCSACAVGTYSEVPASAQCQLCGLGMFADVEGQSYCGLCPKGRFAARPGMSECEACSGLLTTKGYGSTSPLQCTCPANTWFRPVGASSVQQNASQQNATSMSSMGTCEPCGEGLLCGGGRDRPLQAAGFQVISMQDTNGHEVFEAFNCQPGRCVGGTAIGACTAHRLHLACEYCEAGMRSTGDGTCEPCSMGTWVEVSLLGLAGLLVLVALAFFTKGGSMRVVFQQRLHILCCLSVLATTMQVLSTFEGMDIALIHPMRTLNRVLSAVSISLDVLEMGCTLHVASAIQEYAVSVAFYPASLLGFVVVFCAVGRGLHGRRAELFNGLGHLMMILYLPATIQALGPYRCGHNPSGRATLVHHRSVVCWEGTDHYAMVAISVLAIAAFPLGFLAFVARATWTFPSRLVSVRCHQWLRWHSFIFQRFKPEQYYYGMVYLLRSFCIGMLPAMCPNLPQLHILLLGLILIVTGLLQATLLPWRSTVGNYIDLFATTCACITLVAAALIFSGQLGQTTQIVEVFLTANMGLLVLVALGVLAVNAVQYWKPPKRYAVFLSHHKGGGGVLARLFKMLISTRVSGGIFLDSDELDDLDLLVSTIAFSSKNVVVLLTKQTLLRFWCAIELAAAMKSGSNVKVVPVACEDYEPPDDALLDSLSTLWPAEDVAVMATHGITLADVRSAYERLRREPVVKLYRAGGLHAIEGAVDQALGRCSGVIYRSSATSSVDSLMMSGCSSGDKKVVIVGALEDPEARCICHVLQIYLQRELEAEVIVAKDAETFNEPLRAVLVLVVLTRSFMASTGVRQILPFCEGLSLTPVQADPAFEYPTPEFYRQRLSPETARCYKELFRTIALIFSPYASEETQLMEVKAIKRRSALDRDGRLSRKTIESEAREGSVVLWSSSCESSKGCALDGADAETDADEDFADIEFEGKLSTPISKGEEARYVSAWRRGASGANA